MPSTPLTDLELDMLRFERENTWWAYRGAHEQAVRDRFGMSFPAYHLALYRLLSRPEAVRADPTTTRRLRERVARKRVRARV